MSTISTAVFNFRKVFGGDIVQVRVTFEDKCYFGYCSWIAVENDTAETSLRENMLEIPEIVEVNFPMIVTQIKQLHGETAELEVQVKRRIRSEPLDESTRNLVKRLLN
jgi:hypothetical protein